MRFIRFSMSLSDTVVTRSSMGRFLFRLAHSGLARRPGRHDEVVAMDHGGATGIAEYGLDFPRFAAGDPARLVSIVASEPTGDLMSTGVDNGDRIAPMKIAFDASHAGGEQALAFAECRCGALIDKEFAGRLQLTGDPGLAGRHRCSGWCKPGGPPSLFDGAQWMLGLAGSDDHRASADRGDLAG